MAHSGARLAGSREAEDNRERYKSDDGLSAACRKGKCHTCTKLSCEHYCHEALATVTIQ